MNKIFGPILHIFFIANIFSIDASKQSRKISESVISNLSSDLEEQLLNEYNVILKKYNEYLPNKSIINKRILVQQLSALNRRIDAIIDKVGRIDEKYFDKLMSLKFMIENILQ